MNSSADLQLQKLLDSIRLGHEADWIFMAPSSIGEVASICTFTRDFKRIYGGKISMVVHRNHASVPRFFSEYVDSVQTASTVLMRKLTSEKLINPMQFSPGMPVCLWANQMHEGRLLELHRLYVTECGRGGLSFFDMHRYIMRLPWSAQITRGRIDSELSFVAEKYCAQHGIERGKSVIFFPGNNTNLPAPAYLWQSMAKKFTARGIKVFQCTSGAQILPLSLDHSLPSLDMTPGLAVAVSKFAGHVVTGSNGLLLLSLLVSGQCKFDVFLTEGVCTDKPGIFQKANPLLGSHRMVAPEVLNGVETYREWLIRHEAGDDALEKIAEAIVSDKDHSAELKSDVIERELVENFRRRVLA
jgi:hypothetical protein